MNDVTAKEEFRAAALERRATLKERAPELSLAMAGIFLAAIPVFADATISAYSAIRGEADPAPLLKLLRARGHTIVLPRVTGKNKPLDFHLHREGDALVPGGFGLSEPSVNWPKRDPDVLLVPLLAFDATGTRIGYGKGFYDRTLARLRAAGRVLAVGYGFSVQEFLSLPHDDNDQPLDWIVTERAARRFER